MKITVFNERKAALNNDQVPYFTCNYFSYLSDSFLHLFVDVFTAGATEGSHDVFGPDNDPALYLYPVSYLLYPGS